MIKKNDESNIRKEKNQYSSALLWNLRQNRHLEKREGRKYVEYLRINFLFRRRRRKVGTTETITPSSVNHLREVLECVY